MKLEHIFPLAALLWIALSACEAGPAGPVMAQGMPPQGLIVRLAGHTQAWSGQGFDTCEIPAFEALQVWIVHSPYRAVNLYIGGAGRFCSNLGLTASLILRLDEMGWKFIPTWVGPQAPCFTGSKPRMSSDPATAYTQGVAEADAAGTVALGLGLTDADGSGTIVYYDMESYNTANVACNEAVQSFISGWAGQLHAHGNLAGAYGNGAVLSGFATVANVPDAVWPARWIYTSYHPDATVWDVPNLPNSLWADHRRIRQYAGGHNETWGGVTLNIDSDVVDGIVATLTPPGPTHRIYLPAAMNAIASP